MTSKLPCQFCGYANTGGWLSESRLMWRCIDCGTVLCTKCVKHNILSVQCIKCDSKKIKKI